MTRWELALLSTLAVAALISLANPRGLLWLAAGAASYIISSAYADTGLPLHPLAAAICDGLVCLAIYNVCMTYGGSRWELPLFTVFQFSVLVSFTRLVTIESVPEDYTYRLLLELCNWAALAIIIGAGTARLADVVLGDGSGGGHLHRLVRFVSAPQSFDPFWYLSWAKAHWR